MCINHINISTYNGSFDDNYSSSESDITMLASNGYRCTCCGFVSRPSKVVPSGYIYPDSVQQNQITLCRMCFAVNNINIPVNSQSEHGFIIYAPWISQSDLINIVRVAFLAYTRKLKTFVASADSLLSEFSKLSADLKSIIPDYDGDIQGLLEIYDNLNSALKSKLGTLLEGWRYVPSYPAYERIMEYWNASTFHNFSNEQWEEMLCQAQNNVTA